MGFFEKLKEKLKSIKEENKYFARTMARNNNKAQYYGWVNYSIKDGDFRQMSSVNIEQGKGIIYNTSFEDYVFSGDDIASVNYVGIGQHVNQDKMKINTCRFDVAFKDGKTALMDIIGVKVLEFAKNIKYKEMEEWAKENLATILKSF